LQFDSIAEDLGEATSKEEEGDDDSAAAADAARNSLIEAAKRTALRCA